MLHGDRPDRIRTDEPIPAATEVKCPSWLPRAGKTVWKELGPDLIDKGVLTAWDVELFANYCWLSATVHELVRKVDKEGSMVPGAHGVMVKHPAMQLIRDSHASMLRISSRFGLSPSDRRSLSLGPSQDDAEEDLFSSC